MATKVKTWSTWATNSWETLVDAANSANITYAQDAADVAAKFTCATKGTNQTEYGRKSGSGDTWASVFGIATDDIVTAVQLTAWKKKNVAVSKLTSQTFACRIINDSDATLATLVSGISLGNSADGSYVSQTPGSDQTGLSLAGNTNFRLRLELAMVVGTSSGSASVDTRFDDFEITITYSSPIVSANVSDSLHFTEGPTSPAKVGTLSRSISDSIQLTEGPVSPAKVGTLLASTSDPLTFGETVTPNLPIVDVSATVSDTLAFTDQPSAQVGTINVPGVGAVTRENMRLSLLSGSAFIDFSQSGLLTPYVGKKITIKDSTGKQLIGFIKAAGSEETYGSTLISNGGFDSDTIWTKQGGWTIGSGVASYLTEGSSDWLFQSIAVTSGTLYRARFDCKTETASGPSWLIGAWQSYLAWCIGINTAYRTCASTGNQDTGLNTAGFSGTIDDYSFVPVLTPSATGVRIVSFRDGTVYDWAYEEPGFNRNDGDDYTYQIESAYEDISFDEVITPRVGDLQVSARVFDERFEGSGYEEPAWQEEVDSGNTVDEDANTSDVGSPSGWGSQCLKTKAIADSTDAYAYTHLSVGQVSTCWKFEFVITEHNFSNDWDGQRVFSIYGSGWESVFGLDIFRISGQLIPYFTCYYDGIGHGYQAFSPAQLNTRYRVEVKWDVTNHAWSWKFDGVVEPNNVDASYPVTSEGTLTDGHPPDVYWIEVGPAAWRVKQATYYIDNIEVYNEPQKGADSLSFSENVTLQIGTVSASVAETLHVSENLLRNGRVEFTEWSADWRTWATPSTSERSSEQAHSGTYSWKIIADSDEDGTCYKPNNEFVPTVIGQSYLFTGYVYQVIRTGAVVVTVLDSSYQVLGDYLLPLSYDEWLPFSIPFKATTATTVLVCNVQGGGGTATFYCDDWSLSTLPAQIGDLQASVYDAVAFQTPVKLWNERFTSGYDESWNTPPTVDAGCTFDPNASTAGIGSPANWGSYCCHISIDTIADDSWLIAEFPSTYPILFGRCEFYLDSHSLTNGQDADIIMCHNSSWAPRFTIGIYNDGGVLKIIYKSWQEDYSWDYLLSTEISLDTPYRIEWKWDKTNSIGELRINGVYQGKIPTFYPGTTNIANVKLGVTEGDGLVDYYVDNVAFSVGGWIGEETDYVEAKVGDLQVSIYDAVTFGEWVSIGRVSQDDMRLSIINGAAFVDFSHEAVLTPYIGKKLTIYDSTGKALVGYIKAAGSAETFGSELLPNTTLETTDGLTAVTADLAIVGGGQSGNCLRITLTGEYGGAVKPANSSSSGMLIRSSYYLKVTDEIGHLVVEDSSWAQLHNQDFVWPSAWTEYAVYATATGNNPIQHLYQGYEVGDEIFIDTVSAKQVLTPSAMGVTIVSTTGGDTYNWTSEESGFNRNDYNGYTYRIDEGDVSVSVFDTVAFAEVLTPTIGDVLIPSLNGSVEAWNFKFSMSPAFVDFSIPGSFTPHIGKKLVIVDGSGRKLIGYIKAAGTGETYGDELAPNTGLETTANIEVQDGASVVAEGGGFSGNCIKVTSVGFGVALESISTVVGQLYRYTGYVKKGTATYAWCELGQWDGSEWHTLCGVWTDETNWGPFSIYGCTFPGDQNTSVRIQVPDTGTNYWDEISVKRVLTPSVNGVTIVSSPGGDIYSWTSEETGFDRADEDGYTYYIEEATEYLSFSETVTLQIGTVSASVSDALAFGENPYIATIDNVNVSVSDNLVFGDADMAPWSDGFETGDFTAWDEHGAGVTVTTGAAHSGTYGMRVSWSGAETFNAGKSTYSEDIIPASLTSFWFNIQSLTMASGDEFVMGVVFNSIWNELFNIKIYYNGTNHYMFVTARFDPTGQDFIPGYQGSGWNCDSILDGEWHLIQVYCYAGNGNGAVQFWIDGVSRGSISAITNYSRLARKWNMGIGGSDAGTSGEMWFDDFRIEVPSIAMVGDVLAQTSDTVAIGEAPTATIGDLSVSVYDAIAFGENAAIQVSSDFVFISISEDLTFGETPTPQIGTLLRTTSDALHFTENLTRQIGDLQASAFENICIGLWYPGWSYRKSVTASRPDGAVTNYQMKVMVGESSESTGYDVHCEGHCLSTFDDLRFTDAYNNVLDYWIEQITGTTPNQTAAVWVELSSIGTSATTFYMYYGKADAPAYSNGTRTFIVFDDFERGVNGDSVGGIWSVTAGTVQIDSNLAWGGTRCAKFNTTGAMQTTLSGSLDPNIRMAARVRNSGLNQFCQHGNGTYCHGWTSSHGSHLKYLSTGATQVDTGYDITHDDYDLIEMGNLVFAGSGVIDLWLNGVKILDGVTPADYNSTTAGNALRFLSSASQYTYVDNVYVRNYRDVEPAWASWAAEEAVSSKFSEQVTILLGDLSLSIYDAIAFGDNVAGQIQDAGIVYVNISEFITFGESTTRQVGTVSATVAETIAFADGETKGQLGALLASLFDQLAISENIVRQLGDLSGSVSDTIHFGETPGPRVGTLLASVSDLLHLADNNNAEIGALLASIYDNLAFGETVAAYTPGLDYINAYVSDTLHFAENILANLGDLSRSVSDTLTFTEVVTLRMELFGQLSDTLHFAENVIAAVGAVGRSIFDTLTFGETATLRLGDLARSTFDSLSFIETVTPLIGALGRSVSDAIAFGETVTGLIEGAPGRNISTYDNIVFTELLTSSVEGDIGQSGVFDNIRFIEAVRILVTTPGKDPNLFLYTRQDAHYPLRGGDYEYERY